MNHLARVVAIGFLFVAFVRGDTPKIVVAPTYVIHAELFGSTVKLFVSPEKSAQIAATRGQGLTFGFGDMKAPGDTFQGMFVRESTISTLGCTFTFQFHDDAAAKSFYKALSL